MENASILEEKTSIVVNKYIPRLMDGFLVAPGEWMSAVRGFSPLSHSLKFRSFLKRKQLFFQLAFHSGLRAERASQRI